MSLRDIYLVVEGHRSIGLGHVYTGLILLEALERITGERAAVVTIGDLANTVMKQKGYHSTAHIEPETYDISSLSSISNVVLSVRSPEKWNLRKPGITTMLTVLDELGVGDLDADILHNATPITEWYRDTSNFQKALLGLDYYFLPVSFRKYNTMPINHREKRSITVSMGGVDRTNATSNVADILRGLPTQLIESINFILGPGFKFEGDLRHRLADYPYPHTIHRDVDDMGVLLFESDILISAGGNTMYEAACVGTPSIVFWEDPHEQLRGESAETLGFAKSLCQGTDIFKSCSTETIADIITDSKWLDKASHCGRSLIDGLGVDRFVNEVFCDG